MNRLYNKNCLSPIIMFCCSTEKPKFSVSPQDITVNDNEDVTFECLANGDPQPNIRWSREGGSIPSSRARIVDDRNLRISRVKVHDEGSYVCTAENLVGTAEVVARLTVHSK